MLEIKAAIATHLHEACAENRITARPELGLILDQVVFAGANRAAIVTTNWERTVEINVTAGRQWLPVHYLHGDIDKPVNMYLPTEIVEEPYRTPTARTELSHRRARLVTAVGEATKLVLYGLALSPLDVELGQVLASAMNKSKVRQIHVVDPRYPIIAERVAGLVDAEQAHAVEVVGALPNAPTQTWTYAPDEVVAECAKLRLSV